jgi:hypothetical protein
MSNATATCKSDSDMYSSVGGMGGTVRIHKLFSFFIVVLLFGSLASQGHQRILQHSQTKAL